MPSKEVDSMIIYKYIHFERIIHKTKVGVTEYSVRNKTERSSMLS